MNPQVLNLAAGCFLTRVFLFHSDHSSQSLSFPVQDYGTNTVVQKLWNALNWASNTELAATKSSAESRKETSKTTNLSRLTACFSEDISFCSFPFTADYLLAADNRKSNTYLDTVDILKISHRFAPLKSLAFGGAHLIQGECGRLGGCTLNISSELWAVHAWKQSCKCINIWNNSTHVLPHQFGAVEWSWNIKFL